MFLPGIGYFRQHVDAGAHVLAAFVVVRGRGEQGMRVRLQPLLVCAVEIGERCAEAARIATHFVERHQPVVDIETGVFQSFRHQRAGVLLELHRDGGGGRRGPRGGGGAGGGGGAAARGGRRRPGGGARGRGGGAGRGGGGAI